MVTHVAVCGDSFGAGAGLPDNRCFEDSFGGVFARHFDLPLKVYARSGCCNFTIYLQARKIIEQVIQSNGSYKPFVLVTSTYHERIIFPLDNGIEYKMPDLRQVEYESYNPYYDNKSEDSVHRKLEFFPDKQPRLITETVSNITYYRSGRAPGIARLFEKVNREKFNAIDGYFAELYDSGIKRMYDEALYVAMHYELSKHQIPHLIMGNFAHAINDSVNFLQHNWGYYTERYPDPRGSGHCDEEGNRLVGEAAIEYATRNKLL